MEQATFTVTELGELIQTALSQVSPYGIWVVGEVSGLSRSRNGHVYFDLIDPPDIAGARPKASISVVLWKGSRDRVNKTLKRHGNPIRMTDGVQIRMQGTLDFYAGSGRTQLRMSTIDPTYTLGKIAADRDLLLAKLLKEGILRSNASCLMPDVPLRIAMVTSLGSMAHGDILKVLTQSGLSFQITEIDTAVQGKGSEVEIEAAIRAAGLIDVDVAIVARGGGSRTDLAVFDHERVARAIAASPLPVITGIAHEGDRSVADEVAHTPCATPTAAAQRVVSIVNEWLARLDGRQTSIVSRGGSAIARAESNLTTRLGAVSRSARHAGELAQGHLVQVSARLLMAQRHALRDADHRLDSADARTRALDPARALARGWSITRQPDGSLVRSVNDVANGTQLVTQVVDGTLTSTIVSTEPAEEAS